MTLCRVHDGAWTMVIVLLYDDCNLLKYVESV